MPAFFEQFLNDPIALSGLIFLMTFILEDLATGIAGVAAVKHMVPFTNVYIALFLGIFLGDLGLYGLGRAARKFDFAKRFLGQKHVRLSRNWIGKRYVITIIGARFLPGLRLPTYAAFGFFKLPFRIFLATTLVSISLWTGIVLGSIFFFDMTLGEQLGPWKWVGLAGVILAFILGPKLYILKKTDLFKSLKQAVKED